MAKKPTVHNHIDNVTVNIDYSQLAKAILTEQTKGEENKGKKRMGARQLLMAWCNGILYAALYSLVIQEIIKMWQKYTCSGEPSLSSTSAVTLNSSV